MGSHPILLDIGLVLLVSTDLLKYSTDSSNITVILDDYPSHNMCMYVTSYKLGLQFIPAPWRWQVHVP